MNNSISQSRLVNASRQRNTFTEKGMTANTTSLNSCVDMYFMAGAARHWSNEQIETLFQKALAEDPLTALKLMFWARDVRGGAGERNFFRVCLSYLEKYYLGYLKKNINLVPEYGRWDDLFHLNKEIYLPLIKNGLNEKNGLLAKWIPRKGNISNTIRKYMGLTPKEFRKLIVSLSNTVEQLMCSKDFEHINYEHVPSIAMNKYRKSFLKNDKNRFSEYISNVKTGVSKMCAGAIYPYQLYDAFLRSRNENDTESIEAQWYSLPNYMEGSTEKILPMIDTSGSMSFYDGLPARVGWSLGLYISERNESIFKDSFLTFSSKPKMFYLKGTISEKIRSIKNVEWGGTTNVEAAFELLLNKAIENKIAESEMPTVILILSDLQFDPSTISYKYNSYDMITEHYNKAGYKIPKIIYWNLRAKENNVISSAFDKNVGLVSGFSPSCLKSILVGNEIINEEHKEETPYDLMMKVVNSDRYEIIKI